MLTTWFQNVIQGNVWNTGTTPSLPTKYYVGVSSTLPTIIGTNDTEPSGVSYARKQMTGLGIVSDGLVKNTTNLYFTQSTDSWGSVSYYVIYDAPTGGHLCAFGELSATKTINNGVIFTILAGQITFQLNIIQ